MRPCKPTLHAHTAFLAAQPHCIAVPACTPWDPILVSPHLATRLQHQRAQPAPPVPAGPGGPQSGAEEARFPAGALPARTHRAPQREAGAGLCSTWPAGSHLALFFDSITREAATWGPNTHPAGGLPQCTHSTCHPSTPPAAHLAGGGGGARAVCLAVAPHLLLVPLPRRLCLPPGGRHAAGTGRLRAGVVLPACHCWAGWHFAQGGPLWGLPSPTPLVRTLQDEVCLPTRAGICSFNALLYRPACLCRRTAMPCCLRPRWLCWPSARATCSYRKQGSRRQQPGQPGFAQQRLGVLL